MTTTRKVRIPEWAARKSLDGTVVMAPLNPRLERAGNLTEGLRDVKMRARRAAARVYSAVVDAG